MPENMPEHMPEDMPDRMPDRMPEDMSDRMPEDLPVRTCINVMVGIIRSEVICFFVLPSHLTTSQPRSEGLPLQLEVSLQSSRCPPDPRKNRWYLIPIPICSMVLVY